MRQNAASNTVLRIAATLAATLASVVGTTAAAPAQTTADTRPASIARPLTPDTDTTRKPEPKPESSPAARLATSHNTCSTPTSDGRHSCLEVTDTPHNGGLRPSPTLAAGVTPPQWCDQANNQVWGTRTQACIWQTVTYTTYRVSNGQRTTTGQANLIVMQYNYTDTGLGRYAHQIDTSMYSGWGDATKATIDGQATLTGPCTRTSATFPAKPLSPVNSWNTGESFFDSSLVGPATKGKCKTMWYLTFNNAGYDPAVVDYSMNEVRCDNATAGRPGIGCVIPWAASNLVYTRTATPELADHVTKAQASGLPSRLTRTEDQTVIRSNRTRACGSAPSVPGKSCDEYPIATSEQGLNAGGTRRTHPGCGFTGVPAGTGPVGASVCMIAATDNSSQGGTNTQFFRRDRVLQSDPFNVVVQ
ncbi:hypothetical protein [Streptomyces sp. NPDC060010]|uniref:NucA/NucB deoxyribonuclease domain-containing protein n=1 Tax=Streptomyces sp. NPDC060010 TaxID=3347036 RepID=UPI0036BED5E0